MTDSRVNWETNAEIWTLSMKTNNNNTNNKQSFKLFPMSLQAITMFTFHIGTWLKIEKGIGIVDLKVSVDSCRQKDDLLMKVYGHLLSTCKIGKC